MKNVISISFCFENCEACDIPIEFLHYFYIGDITTARHFYPNNQGLHDYVVAGSLSVHFKKSLSEFKEETQFGGLVVDRLAKYNDICWFDINYDDHSKDTYQVKWIGKDPYSNEGQRIENYGNGMIISINREEVEQ